MAKSRRVADEVQCRLGAWMSKEKCRIGIVAPASRMSPEVAERVPTLARSLYPDRTPEIVFHPQCFALHGHFAGDDETRTRVELLGGVMLEKPFRLDALRTAVRASLR